MSRTSNVPPAGSLQISSASGLPARRRLAPCAATVCGIGTLEELYEVWTWRQLGFHDQPIGLLNVDGYYDDLLRFMARTVDQGFLSAPQNAVLQVGDDPAELLLRLAAQVGGASAADDYSRI